MVVAKPGFIAPVLTDVVSEKVIESHGNSVVHASAPVVQTYASVPYAHTFYSAPGVALVGEKTIEAHGNSVVHGSAPLLHSAPLTYAYGLAYNQPLIQAHYL